MADNWLSTDDMLAEVVDHTIKLSGGTLALTIRCPDEATEKRVLAYLKNKRGAKLIDTYVGKLTDSVKSFKSGNDTLSEGDATPVETEDEGEYAPYQSAQDVADCKHEAQMADLEENPEQGDAPPAEGYEGLF